jgi:DNA-directed RNA polymerase sigma subunit (sigma70/sigma32)
MARWDSLRKLERNRQLKEYASQHRDLSLREIGTIFNISEPRVWRILHGNLKAKRKET